MKKKEKNSISIAEAAIAKYKNKQPDKTFSLSEEEFCAINWQKDWPLIIQNLA